MRISAFGLGYVGTVSAGSLANDWHEVVGGRRADSALAEALAEATLACTMDCRSLRRPS